MNIKVSMEIIGDEKKVADVVKRLIKESKVYISWHSEPLGTGPLTFDEEGHYRDKYRT